MAPRSQLAFAPSGLTRQERRILNRLAREQRARTGSAEPDQRVVDDLPVQTILDRWRHGNLPDLKMPTHRGTGWEFVSANPYPVTEVPQVDGPVIGLELSSGGLPMIFHVWNMYEAGILSDSNVLVKGAIGRGKSYWLKRLVELLTIFDVSSINTSDIKGEHGRVAEALGGTTFRLGTLASDARVNPLEDGGPRSTESDEEHRLRVHGTRQAVLKQIASILLEDGHPLRPEEKALLLWALDEVVRDTNNHPTIRELVHCLEDEDRVKRARGGKFRVGDERRLLFIFDELVDGSLRGLFDTHGTVRLNPDSPYTVFDTYAMAQRGDQALAITQAVTNSWVMNVVADKAAGRRIQVIREEGWRDMKTLAGLEAHELQLKLSREFGISLLMAVHEDGDFDTVGAEGSKERALAQKLLRQYSTEVLFAQSEKSILAGLNAGTLTDVEAGLLRMFGEEQGLCMIRSGRRRWVVDGRVTSTPWEQELFDTDQAMRARKAAHDHERAR